METSQRTLWAGPFKSWMKSHAGHRLNVIIQERQQQLRADDDRHGGEHYGPGTCKRIGVPVRQAEDSSEQQQAESEQQLDGCDAEVAQKVPVKNALDEVCHMACREP